MSSLTLKTLQVGTHPTNEDNYHWTSDGAGSLSLNVGSVGGDGSVVSTALSVDGSNNITVPGELTLTGTVTAPTPLSSEASKAATTAYVMTKAQSLSYYKLVQGVQSVAVSGSQGTDIIFDASGNLYWAVTNAFNGSSYAQTNYVYKITPTGAISTFGTVASSTVASNATALAFDSAGNLFWAIAFYYNGTTYSNTSYIYKITSGGVQSQFASRATVGASSTGLITDSSGNVYWAIGNLRGTNSYIYKITSGGSLSTFATIAGTLGACSNLVFDSANNLYCAFSINATTVNVLKITAGGSASTFATYSLAFIEGLSITFDSSWNLYLAATSNNNNGVGNVYKITSAGVSSLLASITVNSCVRTSIVLDNNNNIYWNVNSWIDGSSNRSLPKIIYKISSSGVMSMLAAKTTTGTYSGALKFDSTGNLWWAETPYHNGTTYNLTGYLNCLYKTPVK